MSSIVEMLRKKGIIKPPRHIENSIQYEVMMGSVAYGVSTDTSDIDIYGFSIPYKNIVFPHTAGVIQGFDKNYERFDQYQQHHVKFNEKEYDISIYNIVKYFALVTDNNPNMIDSLFVPQRCILHSTQIGEKVRSKRNIFLHKGCWYKFKGYSYSQIHKIKTKKPEGKRVKIIEKFGYDVKFATHTVRLINECEQILTEHTLDLERNREQLKAIRRGDWKKEQVIEYFETKERELESLYTTSTLPHSPNKELIKELLLDCLEMYYGNLDKTITLPTDIYSLVEDMEEVIDKYRRRIK